MPDWVCKDNVIQFLPRSEGFPHGTRVSRPRRPMCRSMWPPIPHMRPSASACVPPLNVPFAPNRPHRVTERLIRRDRPPEPPPRVTVACGCAEAPAGHHITSSDWAFSSPTPNLPLLMRGIIDACADTTPPASPAHPGSPSEPGGGRIAALTDIACSTFRGARSARQAAAGQFGAVYEPRLERGSGGWLGSAAVREACVLLAHRCLAVCGAPSGEWLERILQLASHMVIRCAPCILPRPAAGASVAAAAARRGRVLCESCRVE